MIIDCVKTGKTSRKGINKQEYQKHNKTMFQKKIISSTCSEVATIMKNFWRHVRERKKNNDGRKIKIPHCKKYSASLGSQSFDIVDEVFTFTVILYKLKISIKLPPYMVNILNNHIVCSATLIPTKLSISYRQKVESEMWMKKLPLKNIKSQGIKTKDSIKRKNNTQAYRVFG